MFKYQIRGTINKTKTLTLALTSYSDLAQFIANHAAEALDPDGSRGLQVEVIVRPEADRLILPPRVGKEG